MPIFPFKFSVADNLPHLPLQVIIKGSKKTAAEANINRPTEDQQDQK